MEADFHNFKQWVAKESELSDRLEDILQTMVNKFEALVENLKERDRMVDRDYEKIGDHLDRHHCRWEVQQEALKIALDKIHVLEAQVESMAGKLCHCGGSEGSEGNPIEVSDSEDDGKSLYTKPMTAEESEEIPQVSGRLSPSLWTVVAPKSVAVKSVKAIVSLAPVSARPIG